MTVTVGDTHTGAVAAEIRAWAARRGLRQGELAARMGVTDMWVSRRFKAKVPITVDELYRFADALGCTVADLLPRLDSNQQPFDLESLQVTGHVANAA